MTENISSYEDHWLQPLVKTLPGYTRDFVNTHKTLDISHGNVQLVTLDVQSLYTSIPHDGGIEAVRDLLNQSSETEKPSRDCTVNLTEVILKNNHFCFQRILSYRNWVLQWATRWCPHMPTCTWDCVVSHELH